MKEQTNCDRKYQNVKMNIVFFAKSLIEYIMDTRGKKINIFEK